MSDLVCEFGRELLHRAQDAVRSRRDETQDLMRGAIVSPQRIAARYEQGSHYECRAMRPTGVPSGANHSTTSGICPSA